MIIIHSTGSILDVDRYFVVYSVFPVTFFSLSLHDRVEQSDDESISDDVCVCVLKTPATMYRASLTKYL